MDKAKLIKKYTQHRRLNKVFYSVEVTNCDLVMICIFLQRSNNLLLRIEVASPCFTLRGNKLLPRMMYLSHAVGMPAQPSAGLSRLQNH